MDTSKNDADEAPTPTGTEQAPFEQYRTITTGDDEVVIYDAEQEDAWIQSAAAVDLKEMV